jgi:hypothetical protein
MVEPQIPVMISCLFLFLPLTRPLVKRLWPMEGLVWLPLLALAILIALFPAYGFRPECVPLLVVAFAINLANIPALASRLSHLRNDDFRERRPALTILAFLCLLGTGGIALAFPPAPGPVLLSQGVRSFTLRDESRQAELYLRVYGPEAPPLPSPPAGPGRPLLVMVPPAAGSVGVVDSLCGELRDLGFTVISFSRRGFDFSAITEGGRRILPGPGQLFRLLRIIARGDRSVGANAQGRWLEETRREDTAFLLGRICRGERPGQNGRTGREKPPGEPLPAELLAGADRERIFLAGCGDGGAALLLLAGERDFAARFPGVRGIIAVESPILTALRGETPEAPAAPSPNRNWFRATWAGLSTWVRGLKPQRISGIEPIAGPAVPLLLLVSDTAFDRSRHIRRYTTVWRVFEAAEKPAILAAAPGAGPLDYSDVPQKYPLYAALFPGEPKARNAALPPGAAAALMANFAALLLEGAAGDGPQPAPDAPAAPDTANIPAAPGLVKKPPLPGLRVETRGVWNFRDPRYIL